MAVLSPEGQPSLKEEKESIFVLGGVRHVLRNCILVLTMPVKAIYLSINVYLLSIICIFITIQLETEANPTRSLLSQQ